MKILLIDSDAICWGVFHALPNLSNEEMPTAVIYGFLTRLMEFQEKEQADVIVFAWDSRESKRKELDPTYKGSREEKRQDYTEEEKELHRQRNWQFKELRTKILPKLGFKNNFKQEGYEGDDVIASIVNDYRHNEIVIYGRDNDLFQLVSDNVSLYDWVTRKMYTPKKFHEIWGIYPEKWAEVKSIAGCPGDDVPGVPGIAYKRAIAYITGTMKVTSKFYNDIANSKDIIEHTAKLVVLPFEGTDSFQIQPDKCSMMLFNEVIDEYGLKSYRHRNRQREYKEYFCGPKNTNIKQRKKPQEEKEEKAKEGKGRRKLKSTTKEKKRKKKDKKSGKHKKKGKKKVQSGSV